mmetsp:Transcript_14812/g.46442  ORF Transcript_14812/g.46442 Transcript_14812/m.46442 type:complete len:240 (-) Transcript_14812:225-944(-)
MVGTRDSRSMRMPCRYRLNRATAMMGKYIMCWKGTSVLNTASSTHVIESIFHDGRDDRNIASVIANTGMCVMSGSWSHSFTVAWCMLCVNFHQPTEIPVAALPKRPPTQWAATRDLMGELCIRSCPSQALWCQKRARSNDERAVAARGGRPTCRATTERPPRVSAARATETKKVTSVSYMPLSSTVRNSASLSALYACCAGESFNGSARPIAYVASIFWLFASRCQTRNGSDASRPPQV